METLVIDISLSQSFLKENFDKIFDMKTKEQAFSIFRDPKVIIDFVGENYTVGIEKEEVFVTEASKFKHVCFRSFSFIAIITVKSFSSFLCYLETQDCYDMENEELDTENFALNFLSGWVDIHIDEDNTKEIYEILPFKEHIDGEIRRLNWHVIK